MAASTVSVHVLLFKLKPWKRLLGKRLWSIKVRLSHTAVFIVLTILAGIHPEMQHLHEELSKRRDKRLELASLRRDYEVTNVTKRRKLDEDGVWSWWKVRTRSYASVSCDCAWQTLTLVV